MAIAKIKVIELTEGDVFSIEEDSSLYVVEGLTRDTDFGPLLVKVPDYKNKMAFRSDHDTVYLYTGEDACIIHI